MEDERPACSACGGELQYLGTLRTLDHFRCRACGIDQSRPAVGDDEPDEFPTYDDECEPIEGDV